MSVTMKGNPVTLRGNIPQEGQQAPDAKLTANDLSETNISGYIGKKLILSVVPSLDTAVCDLQTKRFNEEAGKLGDDVQILTISMDLPFAQKRWCSATGSDKIVTLSDHRDGDFGEKYGLLIGDLRLLARAVFVITPDGNIVYKQIVPEITEQPDYEPVLKAVQSL